MGLLPDYGIFLRSRPLGAQAAPAGNDVRPRRVEWRAHVRLPGCRRGGACPFAPARNRSAILRFVAEWENDEPRTPPFFRPVRPPCRRSGIDVVFARLRAMQAAGGAVVGAVVGSVAHSSEEEHGLAPANYPWSHEGMLNSFDASSCVHLPAVVPRVCFGRFWRARSRRAVAI